MTSVDLDVAAVEFLDLPGYRTAYRQWGATDSNEAVVLLHGITSSSLSWIRVAPDLAHDGTRVIAVDLKGHGDSGRPASGYRLEDQADEVVALCSRLGLRSILLMGHSWGGVISLIIGARNVVPLHHVVLEDPAINVRSGDADQRRQVVEMYVSSVGLSREEAEARVRATVAPGWTEQDILGKVDASVKGSPASVRAVFDENGAWDYVDRLADLRVPTLLIRADVANGGIVSEAVVAAAQRNPLVQVVTVPGADHNIHRGQYDAFMRALRRFLTVQPRSAVARSRS
jgi:pimeloyl-ACP methyl ester carboxylesterase